MSPGVPESVTAVVQSTNGVIQSSVTNVDIRATVYRDSDDTQLAQVTGTDTDSSGALVDGGIGIFQRGKNLAGGLQFFVDEIQTETNTIDDVEDGNDSEYSVATSGGIDPAVGLQAQQGTVYNGSYALMIDDSPNEGENITATSVPGDGLPYYPEHGDTVTFYVRYSGTTRTDRVHIGVQSNVEDSNISELPDNAYEVEMDTRDTGGQFEITARGQSFSSDSTSFNYGAEEDTWLRIEIEWGVNQ